MTPREFANARIAWEELEESRQRSEWERTRWLGFTVAVFSGNVKKGTLKTEQDLLKFPWEKGRLEGFIEKTKKLKDSYQFKRIFPDKIDGKE